MTKFEQELIDLIGKHRDKGVSWDDIISAMEMQMMAAHEQEQEDADG